MAAQTSGDKHRTVAMILTDIKSSDNRWFNDIPTLVDSGGCESVINANFAYTNGFTVQEDNSPNSNVHATSACGGAVYFNKFVEIEVKMGQMYTKERFYLMDNLPRVLLLGFPFFQETETTLNARAGTFYIADFKETIPLCKIQKDSDTELVFATFGFLQPSSEATQIIHPVQLLVPQMSVLANPYGSYIEEELHYSKNFETIKNIFATTTSRQRSTPMDDEYYSIKFY